MSTIKFCILLFLFPIFTIGQENEYPSKNDISIFTGTMLSNAWALLPGSGLEYRHEFRDKWKLKLSYVFGKSSFRTPEYTGGFSFIFDGFQYFMIRQESYFGSCMHTAQFGIDYELSKNFTIGGQVSIGNFIGISQINDIATIYDPGKNASVASREITIEYHSGDPSFYPPQNFRIANEELKLLTYVHKGISYGFGLTAEARIPLFRRFELALQYNPEINFYSVIENQRLYDFDDYTTSELPLKYNFAHFANIFFRFKF